VPFFNAAGFRCPSVLDLRSAAANRDVILGYGQSLRCLHGASFGRLATASLVQATITKTAVKLRFVNPDRSRDPGHALGRNFSLPNPEVDGIWRDSEPLGYLTYFGESVCHRHVPVISSNHGNALESAV
jgi:hypothetical protein